MKFTSLELPGAWRVELERHRDERGFFARTWCRREFTEHGIDARLVQCNISYNRAVATLRGLHWQAAPHQEPKLVRCTRGEIWDVVVDLRADSPTYLAWHGESLSAENGRALFIPVGCAHGFLTLEPESEVHYQMGEYYAPEATRGARWDDPAFDIAWPRQPQVISERDRGFPDFEPETA